MKNNNFPDSQFCSNERVDDENDGQKTESVSEELKSVTFKKFLTHEQLLERASSCMSCFHDFYGAGYSIREMYDGLFHKIVQVSHFLMGRGATGYFWIVGTPKVISGLTLREEFEPMSFVADIIPANKECADIGHYPVGGWSDKIQWLGLLSSSWRVYTNPRLETDEILVGVNDTLQDQDHYFRIRLSNFIL
jgi:hypothetical protein